jgi:hypothetical protein
MVGQSVYLPRAPKSLATPLFVSIYHSTRRHIPEQSNNRRTDHHNKFTCYIIYYGLQIFLNRT